MTPNYALRRSLAPNVFEAFRQLVMLGDVPALAVRMGMRPGTLYNKADAGDDSHNQPSLRDVVLATEITGDLRVVDALNEMFGRASYDARAQAEATDEALLELLAELGAQHGEFHAALAEGLKARRFTAASFKKISAEAFDVVAALMTLVRRVEGYVDDADHAPV